MSFVYILRCGDGSLYTGIAKDLAARLREHQRGRASRYTRARLPVTVVWSRRVPTWSQALREEHRIKKLRRRDKEALIAKRSTTRAAPGRRSGARLRGSGKPPASRSSPAARSGSPPGRSR